MAIIKLSTGSKKNHRKFRNADAARKSRENQDCWNQLKKQWGVDSSQKKLTTSSVKECYKSPNVVRRDTGSYVPSLSTNLGTCSKAPPKVYTGNAVLGISTLHKSNAVPVFSKEEAIDVSRMRR